VRVVEEALKDADLGIELVDVSGGTANLWGAVQPDVEKRAIRAAAESYLVSKLYTTTSACCQRMCARRSGWSGRVTVLRSGADRREIAARTRSERFGSALRAEFR
jgi:hypothetical protein